MIKYLCDKGYSGCAVENCTGLDGAKVEAGRKTFQESRSEELRPK